MELKEIIAKILAIIARGTKKPRIDLDTKTSELVIQVDQKDQGRVIGKSGVTIAALNVIAWYIGKHLVKKPVTIVLLEPVGREEAKIPFMPKEELDEEELTDFIKNILFGIGCKTHSVAVKKDIKHYDVVVSLPKVWEKVLQDPDFDTAFSSLIKTAGRFCGGNVETEIHYGDT